MNLALLRQCIREARLLLLGCSGALFAFCWIRVWVVGRIDMSRFRGILEILRPEFENFSAVDFEQALTYPGRVAFTYNEPLLIILAVVWAIARGSDTVSGPLGRGTLEMMLSQPISRLQFVLHKSAVTAVGSVIIALAAWLGIYCGIENTTVKQENLPLKFQIPLVKVEVELPFSRGGGPQRVPLSDFVDSADMFPSALNLMGLGLFFGGFTALMSSWDQYRWRTIAIAAGFLIIQMLLRVLSLALDDVTWIQYTTIMSLYEPETIVSRAVNQPQGVWTLVFEKTEGEWELGGMAYTLLLSLGGIGGFAWSAWIFCRRDLPAPV